MNTNWMLDPSRGFERIVVAVLLVLMMFVVGVGVYDFFTSVLASVDLIGPTDTTTFEDLKAAFSAFLMVLIGLELLQTIKMYLSEDTIHVEVIVAVALISVGRHIIELDLPHLPPMMGGSIGVLVLSLALAFVLIRKAPSPRQQPNSESVGKGVDSSS